MKKTEPNPPLEPQRSAKMNEGPEGSGLGVILGMGVMLPITCGIIYATGFILREDWLLPFVLGITILAGVGGYCIGVRCRSPLLTRLGMLGYAIFALGLVILYWQTSKPISIPPYP